MKKWQLWAGIILVFIAGVTLGVAGTALYVRHTVRSLVLDGPQVMNRLVTNKLTRELDLTREQQAAVSRVVRQTQNRLQSLRLRNRPETELILATGVAQLKGELSPEQGKKLDALHGQLRVHWATRDRRFVQ